MAVVAKAVSLDMEEFKVLYYNLRYKEKSFMKNVLPKIGKQIKKFPRLFESLSVDNYIDLVPCCILGPHPDQDHH